MLQRADGVIVVVLKKYRASDGETEKHGLFVAHQDKNSTFTRCFKTTDEHEQSQRKNPRSCLVYVGDSFLTKYVHRHALVRSNPLRTSGPKVIRRSALCCRYPSKRQVALRYFACFTFEPPCPRWGGTPADRGTVGCRKRRPVTKNTCVHMLESRNIFVSSRQLPQNTPSGPGTPEVVFGVRLGVANVLFDDGACPNNRLFVVDLQLQTPNSSRRI